MVPIQNSLRMLKKARLLTRPTLARRDAPYPKQGRSSLADARFTFHASRFTAPGSEARTMLADFFSILLEAPASAPHYDAGEKHGGRQEDDLQIEQCTFL